MRAHWALCPHITGSLPRTNGGGAIFARLAGFANLFLIAGCTQRRRNIGMLDFSFTKQKLDVDEQRHRRTEQKVWISKKKKGFGN